MDLIWAFIEAYLVKAYFNSSLWYDLKGDDTRAQQLFKRANILSGAGVRTSCDMKSQNIFIISPDI